MNASDERVPKPAEHSGMAAGTDGTKPRLRELDALRGLAAVSVMIFHYTTIFPDFFPENRNVGVRFEAGGYGVFLFFGISGFVISRTLEATTGLADFTAKRFARLFPAYWAAILLTTLIVQFSDTSLLRSQLVTVLVNFTMLQDFLLFPAVDGVYWTLSVELAFYLCAALAWLAKGKVQFEHLLMAWMAAGTLAFAGDALPYRLQMLVVAQHSSFFVIGMLTYRTWAGKRRYREQLVYFAMAVTAAGIVGGIAYVIAALSIQLTLWMAATGRLSALTHPTLLYLGALSYPLYLIHHHIGFVMLRAADHWQISPWLSLLAVSSTMIGVAAVLHVCIEVPAERIIRTRFLSKRRTSEIHQST